MISEATTGPLLDEGDGGGGPRGDERSAEHEGHGATRVFCGCGIAGVSGGPSVPNGILILKLVPDLLLQEFKHIGLDRRGERK